MKRQFILIFLIVLFANLSFAQEIEVHGKLIDKEFKPLVGVKIENLSTKLQTRSDKSGNYVIKATLNDTLTFNLIGLTEEVRVVSENKINVILIDKTLNCLGSPWSDRKWKKEQKRVDKYYEKLYKIANRENHWDTEE